MNAHQRPHPLRQSIQEQKISPRPKRHLRQRSYQIMALETMAKIGVNLIISVASVSALIHLLPYNWVQQQKLRGIRTEVKLAQGRVNSLQKEFSHNFDPQQAKSVMEQQAYRFDPSQRQVILINKDDKELEQSSSSP